jgi:hypothetical protein
MENTMTETVEIDTANAEKLFPAGETAYPLAIAAYDIAMRRFDSVDSRISTLLTFVITVSLAIPVLANAKGLSLHSAWFWLAVVSFVAGTIVALFARLHGKLHVLHPAKLYKSYLHLTEPRFKLQMIYWSGEHLSDNLKLINRNGRLAGASAFLFLLEAIFIAAWAAGYS